MILQPCGCKGTKPLPTLLPRKPSASVKKSIQTWYLEGLHEKLMCTLQIERAALAI